MKKLLAFASAALLMVGCHDDSSIETIAGEGAMKICATASGEVITKAGEESGVMVDVPQIADFALKITGNNFEKSWDSVSDYDFESERYTAGKYNVSIEYGDATAEGYNVPYFYALQEVEVLDRNRTTNVELVATVGNAIVEVVTTENFRGYFPQHKFTMTTASNTFELKENDDELLFVAPQENVAIDCTCIRQSNLASGKEETLATQYIQTVKARTRYIVTYDLRSAGNVTITVTLNETIIDTFEVEVELNENA